MPRQHSSASAAAAPALAPNAFIGLPHPPTDADLCNALGPTKLFWDDLIASLSADCSLDVQEWKSYSRKSGWSLRLARGKRTIVWLGPLDGAFRVGFILGDKALAAARAGGFSARMEKIFDEAPHYPEGTGIRITVDGPKDLPAIRKLARIKTAP